MMRYLRKLFERERGALPARELLERQRSRRAMISLFLAMLEMVKLQALGLVQANGEIGLKRVEGFENAFTAEETMNAIEEGYR
jgi:segregation and condensation protein A